MRIIHLACVAPPEIGGIGQAAYDEVVGLRERGEEATLVSRIGNRESRIECPIPDSRFPILDSIVRLPTWIRAGNASIPIGLWNVLRGADVIHLHYPWYGVAERLLLLQSRVPVVVTFHMDATADDWRGNVFDLHRKLLQPRLLQRASKILVSSRDYAEQSSLRHTLDELGDKVVELPFGLDTDFFCPVDDRSDRCRGAWHAPVPGPIGGDGSMPSTPTTNTLSILFVGGLDRAHDFKGLSVLLEAMRALPNNVTLDIIGDGAERGSFEKRVEEMGLAGRVRFRGRVDREALREAYRTATVLAVPSTSAAEAFGLVALEAQACGLPVVASRLPGVRTVVRDQETGLLVEPGSVTELAQALHRILTDTALRATLATAARRRAIDVYSAPHHIDRLLEVYQYVSKNRGANQCLPPS